MVLELLASSADLSQASAGRAALDGATYGVDAGRYGPPAPPVGRPRQPPPGHHHAPDGATAETVAQPVKVDNDLYVRDYAPLHPVLQVRQGVRHRRAVHVRDRRGRARVRRPHRHRVRQPAARLRLRLLRQLHRGLPDRGAQVGRASTSCARPASGSRSSETVTTTICSFCGVGCNLELHVQHGQIVNVTSPAGPLRHPRAPVHQGPLRLPARAEPPRRNPQGRRSRSALRERTGPARARPPTRPARGRPRADPSANAPAQRKRASSAPSPSKPGSRSGGPGAAPRHDKRSAPANRSKIGEQGAAKDRVRRGT